MDIFSGSCSGQFARIVSITTSYMTLYPSGAKCSPRSYHLATIVNAKGKGKQQTIRQQLLQSLIIRQIPGSRQRLALLPSRRCHARSPQVCDRDAQRCSELIRRLRVQLRIAGGPARVRKTLGSVERFQLVFVNWRWCYEDDPGLVSLCCWVLDDGLEVLLEIVQGDVLGIPREAGVICAEEYCLSSSLLVSIDCIN